MKDFGEIIKTGILSIDNILVYPFEIRSMKYPATGKLPTLFKKLKEYSYEGLSSAGNELF